METATGTSRSVERALERLEGLRALDPVAERIADAVVRVTDDRRLRNLLSGTPSGHPLHPALTDVPMGLLHAAALLELVPTTWARRAATFLLVCGLAAALPTAATGASDWSHTSGEARRVGLVHGGLNALAVGFYGIALLRRARGSEAGARGMSLLGYVTTLVAAFLGGHLAFRLGVGVDQHATRAVSGTWTTVGPLAELPDHRLVGTEVGGERVALYRSGATVYAVADRCSHAGGPLSEGHVHADTLEVGCPWHHSMFDLRDGAVTQGPATAPQPTYDVRLFDGEVQVRPRT